MTKNLNKKYVLEMGEDCKEETFKESLKKINDNARVAGGLKGGRSRIW